MNSASEFAAHPLHVPTATLLYQSMSDIGQHPSEFCNGHQHAGSLPPLSAL
jgi:hypothetical protein